MEEEDDILNILQSIPVTEEDIKNCVKNIKKEAEENSIPRKDLQGIEGTYNRAKKIRNNLISQSHHHSPTVFNAFVPPAVPKEKRPKKSPLNHQSDSFNFQIASENIQELADQQHHVSLETNKIAKKIGADTRSLASSRNKTRQTTEQQHESQSSRVSKNAPTIPIRVQQQPTLPLKTTSTKQDKAVQTTENTGSFKFEISCKELQNLSNEKRKILRDFMKEFKIKDSRTTESLKDRLDFRKNTWKNGDESKHTRNRTTRDRSRSRDRTTRENSSSRDRVRRRSRSRDSRERYYRQQEEQRNYRKENERRKSPAKKQFNLKCGPPL